MIQVAAINPKSIPVGSGKIEIAEIGADVWVDLGLADNIQIIVSRETAPTIGSDGLTTTTAIIDETATIEFLLWERYLQNLSMLDGGATDLSESSGAIERRWGDESSVGKLQLRITSLGDIADAGTRIWRFFSVRIGDQEELTLAANKSTDPYNRTRVTLLAERDETRDNSRLGFERIDLLDVYDGGDATTITFIQILDGLAASDTIYDYEINGGAA
jgi:hypothetical protein